MVAFLAGLATALGGSLLSFFAVDSYFDAKNVDPVSDPGFNVTSFVFGMFAITAGYFLLRKL